MKKPRTPDDEYDTDYYGEELDLSRVSLSSHSGSDD